MALLPDGPSSGHTDGLGSKSSSLRSCLRPERIATSGRDGSLAPEVSAATFDFGFRIRTPGDEPNREMGPGGPGFELPLPAVAAAAAAAGAAGVIAFQAWRRSQYAVLGTPPTSASGPVTPGAAAAVEPFFFLGVVRFEVLRLSVYATRCLGSLSLS